jgi:hypothetical protein
VRKGMVADLRPNRLELLAQMFAQLLHAGFHSGALCGFKPVAIAVTCEKRSRLCRTKAWSSQRSKAGGVHSAGRRHSIIRAMSRASTVSVLALRPRLRVKSLTRRGLR